MTSTISEVSGKLFDFIIIGGGTAGLVVANRLSEDTSTTVLVLEAGSANLNDPAILIPAQYGTHFGNPQYDWAFETTPQKFCDGKTFIWNRGKSLGGSSAINFMMYNLPPKDDLDAIEKLGNPGWNWETMRKYYSRVEGFVEPETTAGGVQYDMAHHNTTGLLKVSYPVVQSNLELPYQEAIMSQGTPRCKEPFSGIHAGTWITPQTIEPRSLTRSYSANRYYQSVAHRQNLVVLTEAYVSNLVLGPKNEAGDAFVTGVQFIHGETSHEVQALKEIILSAGTIMNPQILELSGVGRPDILEAAKVPVRLALPGVGQNLQEHFFSMTVFSIRKEKEAEFNTFDLLTDPGQFSSQLELREKRKGAFGMGIGNVTFTPLSLLSPKASFIQAQLVDTIEEAIDDGRIPSTLAKQYRIQLDKIKRNGATCQVAMLQGFLGTPNPPLLGRKHLTLGMILNHPFSRGSIHIKSNDPQERPAIDPHYFEEKYDLESLVEMTKASRALAQTAAFHDIIDAEINPGLGVQTDEQMADFLKANISTTWHSVGTCSMLPREDLGVVDTQLKVYGTTNLRVIDISVIPLHIGAQTQATAYAIGEIGADIIKGKFNAA